MIILDVRERSEYEAEHIPDSIFCPLSEFDLIAPGILKNIKDSEVVVMCRSGNRAQIALNEIKKLDINRNSFTFYEGGILKWKSEGKTLRKKGSAFPLMRQVQIVASTLIFLAFIGAQLIHPHFVYLALFVGCGLAFAGYTGICPTFSVLQKMPWNNKKMQENGGEKSKNNCCS